MRARRGRDFAPAEIRAAKASADGARAREDVATAQGCSAGFSTRTTKHFRHYYNLILLLFYYLLFNTVRFLLT